MTKVDVRLAEPGDLPDLARLAWLNGSPEELQAQALPAFRSDFSRWYAAHRHSHLPFVAEDAAVGLVAMAWLARLPRVPRPGDLTRESADLQAVFVPAELRGRGIGTALVRCVLEHAWGLGVRRVTVSSATRAVPVYERVGFVASPELMEIRPPNSA